MKKWFENYFSIVFAGYLIGCSLWFAYLNNWSAWAGYMCAAMGWMLVWFIERRYDRYVEEIRRIYDSSIEEISQEYRESIKRIRGAKDAT